MLNEINCRYLPRIPLRVKLRRDRQALSRYHARIDEGGATAFAAFVEKATRRPVRCGGLAMRMALASAGKRSGDQAAATGDERMASEGRFRRKRASGAVWGLGDADGYGTREGGDRPSREDGCWDA
jgi:hypothetical protein